MSALRAEGDAAGGWPDYAAVKEARRWMLYWLIDGGMLLAIVILLLAPRRIDP